MRTGHPKQTHRRERTSVLCGMLMLSATVVAGQEHPGDRYLDLETKEREDGSIAVYAVNNHVLPLWIYVDVHNLQGFETSESLPYSGPVPLPEDTRGGDRESGDGGGTHLFTLHRSDNARRLSYRLEYRYARGIPGDVDHDDDHVYLLPFEHGQRFRLDQGYGGEFTHRGENRYALDFVMEVGTPVYAARSGTVVEVREDSDRGGRSSAYADSANYIFIRHEDGSIGNYVHLKQGGALVEVGDTVQAGERIGLSGNTGQSSGPHLHFDVRVPEEDGRMQSIPTQFMNHEGETVDGDLEAGRYYYARHPGKGDFEAVFGAELTNEDFADHEKSVERSNTVSFETEQIDDTIVVYIRNGYTHPVRVTTELRLRGLEASTNEKLERELPALTERFLTILQPRESARRYQYGFNYRYSRADTEN